jgi:hypothetical protein
MATDLQSAPFGHLGTCPKSPARKFQLQNHRLHFASHDGKQEQANPRTAPPSLKIRIKVVNCGDSHVQETADSIDEVS